VRLYVNGQLVADKWVTGLGTPTGTIALQAGQWYDIKMEYGASLGNAKAILEYSSPSEPRKVIPSTNLRPPADTLRPPADTPPPPSTTRQVALGAFVPGSNPSENNGSFAALDAHNQKVGYTSEFFQFFAPWKSPWAGVDTSFREDLANASHARGANPVFLWMPIETADYSSLSQPNYQMADILAGHHDAYIRNWAREAQAWSVGHGGERVYLRLFHEGNGSWFSYYPYNNGNRGTAEWIAAWRHVHTLFQQEGATNVEFAWTMGANWYGASDRSNVLPISQLYPGDAYVDVVGLDQYTGLYGSWLSLQEMFVRDYDEMVALAGPEEQVWLAEVGATEDYRRPDWMGTGFLDTVSNRFPEVSAVGYWHESPFGVDTSQASLDAYRQVAADPLYDGRLP